ncbi:hypothetical protein BT67DRAFT_363308, partial [Trichocladium antarcticum]
GALGTLLASPAAAFKHARQATPSAPSATACNNSPLLCSRAYSNITHMGAHDSAFLRDKSTGNSIAGNQYYNATVALSAGLRLLQAQVHITSNQTLQLCHTLCELLDAGPLAAWLAKIRHWLDTHPNEVVTLLLVNSDSAPPSAFAAAFEASGIARYAFTPNENNTTWPTLAALIAHNTRLITFITPLPPDPPPPPSSSPPPLPKTDYLLPEFATLFETAYNTTSLTTFTCALDRPATSPPSSAAAALAAGLLPLLNHLAHHRLAGDLLIPDASNIETTNSAAADVPGALGRHVHDCAAEWGGGVRPLLVLVDFWDRGAVMAVADRLNGVAGEVVGRVD